MRFPSRFKSVVVTAIPFAALGLSLLIATPVWAQVTGATLAGTVTDASGGIVPNAQVSVRNLATGISAVVSANAEGFYSMPNLLAGAYEMSASAPGFSTVVQGGVILTVGAQQVLNFTLKVGQVTESVEVTGAAPTVQLASSSIGTVVSPNTVVELPLNGRDWTQLATLQSGVNVVQTQQPALSGSARISRGFGNAMTISGTRPQANNYRLDGISIVDYSGGPPGSVLGIALGVDAIAEFSVLTSNYDASYGRTAGGVVNAITRSGTNQIHGGAYEFLRNSDLDARNFFDTTIPPFRRNQFGASAGGPIQKDKTFFFADYEGLRQDLGMTAVNNVPSQDARNGILHNPDGTTTVVAVDPLVKRFLPFWPLPNAGLIGVGNTGHFLSDVSNITPENFGTARIDRKISGKDSIFGTWLYDSALIEAADPLKNVVNGNSSARQTLVLEETHVFGPALVNSVRGGYSRVTANAGKTVSLTNPLTGDTSLGSFPGRGPATITVPGLTTFGGGRGGLSPISHYWNSFQGYDDAFLIKGVHSLKVGFAFELMQDNNLSNSFPDGAFTFGSLANFLTNHPTTFKGGLPGTITPRHERASLFGGYLQDDWRWRPNLTLNLGLRYEASTVPSETQGKLENLRDLTAMPPGHLGSPLFNNPTLRNFEPRVGFSWDPFRNGKTAVRGAFGIFDILPLIATVSKPYVAPAPFTELVAAANLPAGSFPTGAVPSAQVQASTLRYAFVDFNPRRNYVMIWNLNVQRQLTPSTTMMFGYVGNHGVHMTQSYDDMDLVVPTATPQGYLWPFPVASGTRVNPNAGSIVGLDKKGSSLYDALELQVAKRMSHGFQVQGSYTWGRNIDTGSAEIVGDPYTNSVSSPLWFCSSCRRGLSDFNVAQTLVVYYIWDAPTPKNLGAIASHVLGGWELGGIITTETGVPFTPRIGGDPLGENSTDPLDYPNRLTGPGCQSPVNPGNPNNYINLSCFAVPMATPSIAAQCKAFSAVPGSCSNLMGNTGRNSVIGPGLATWDFSLFKNNYITKISENFNAQFRTEFFNILNRANFAAPVDNETLFTVAGAPVGGAGAVDQTSTTAREIQFALKLIW